MWPLIQWTVNSIKLGSVTGSMDSLHNRCTSLLEANEHKKGDMKERVEDLTVTASVRSERPTRGFSEWFKFSNVSQCLGFERVLCLPLCASNGFCSSASDQEALPCYSLQGLAQRTHRLRGSVCQAAVNK